jgi:hypothetical protein
VAAHSLRECRRAMVRRRGQFAGPWVSGHTDACMHVGVGGRWDRFSTIEKRRREYAGCRARSARVPESDGATVRAGCRTLGIRSQRCLYACWRGRSMGPIFDHREAAAGVCGLQRTVCESAGERWHNGAGGLPDLKISAPSVVARILVWARDATDFRPSINGVGGACASRRTVWESGREQSMGRPGRLVAGP